MAKTKTFTYDGEGSATVYVPGHSNFQVEPGESVDADDPAVIAALEANPDFSKGKRSEKKGK